MTTINIKLTMKQYTPDTTGVQLIADERKRQIEQEGYSSQHDLEHIEGELAYAAICYADPRRQLVKLADGDTAAAANGKLAVVHLPDGPQGPGTYYIKPNSFWPFEPDMWKPSKDDRIRDLTKAGAMIAAEIDRLLAQPKNK